jgi:thiol-disulfide isomerase/thioredoxin
MSRRSLILLAVIAIFSAGAGFLTGQRANQETLATAQLQSADVVGQRLPSFSAADLDDQQRSIQDWDGQPRLINFWATWCAPCRREMPDLMALHDELDGQAMVIGIALDFPEEVKLYVEELGIKYPILIADDLAGTRLVRDLGNANGLLPYSVFVDQQGVIREVKLGELTREEAKQRLQALM